MTGASKKGYVAAINVSPSVQSLERCAPLTGSLWELQREINGVHHCLSDRHVVPLTTGGGQAIEGRRILDGHALKAQARR